MPNEIWLYRGLKPRHLMYKINDSLATHGLEWQWGDDPERQNMIEQPDENGMIGGFKVLDIRERMVDARGVPLALYKKLTNEAISLILKYGKVVICCSAGVSRSNSIGIAVLVRHFGMDFDEACKLVKDKVPIANPLPCHLAQLRKSC